MASSEERDEILGLVAEGKLSAGEAIRLLSAEGKKSAEAATVTAADAAEDAKEMAAPPAETSDAPMEGPTAASEGGEGPNWLKVRVSGRDGRDRVRVNIPLRVVRLGMRLGAGFVPELRRQSLDDLDAMLAAGSGGLLVDVQDEDRGEHVQVYVE